MVKGAFWIILAAVLLLFIFILAMGASPGAWIILAILALVAVVLLVAMLMAGKGPR